jgi:hypothetical protein
MSITTQKLLSVFNGSPLATHTIRHRLGKSPKLVAFAIYRAIDSGHLRRVDPTEVGSGKRKMSVYAPNSKQ